MKNFNIKKIVANFLLVVTFLSALSVFASAQPTNTNTNTTVGTAITDSFSNWFRVQPKQVKVHKYYFRAGDDVDIELEGDGYTNLDLYVYDSKGNLIDRQDGSTDYELSSLEIYRSGYFTVKVVNRGRDFNDYQLSVDAY